MIKLKPVVKGINIAISDSYLNIKNAIAASIFNDFNQFRVDNELDNCSLKQSKINHNVIVVTFSTKNKYCEQPDLGKIQSDFNNFIKSNKDDLCQMSEVQFEDDSYYVTYTIYREYVLLRSRI